MLDDVILLGDYIKAELNIQKLTVCADPAQYSPLLCAITAFPIPNLIHMTGSTCNCAQKLGKMSVASASARSIHIYI